MELLLDAVTNAFGGILFLAILIVILVNQTSDRSKKLREPENQPAELRRHVTSLRAQVESLTQAIQEQEISLSRLKLGEEAERYENVVEMQKKISQLEQEREQFVIDNKELLERAAQARRSQSQLDLQIRDFEDHKASLEDELARLKLPQIRTAKTPRLRKSYKREFPIILRYGRIYVPYVLDPVNGTKTFNEEEFILVDDTIEVTRVTPKPYRGIPLDDIEMLSTQLAQSLDNIDEKDYYIAIAAWSDSFGEFNELRNAIVNLGYEYRIIPVEPGGSIQEGSIGESLVQ